MLKSLLDNGNNSPDSGASPGPDSTPPSGGPIIDRLSVPTNTAAGVNSHIVLQSGISYTLIARGDFQYGAFTSDRADAQYRNFAHPTHFSTDGTTPIGIEVTGVTIGGSLPRWGAYRPTHSYFITVVGRGQALHAFYQEAAGSYGTHQGSMQLLVTQGSSCPPPLDTPPVDCCGSKGDLAQNAQGSDGGNAYSNTFSEGKVRYADGLVDQRQDDGLNSDGFGTPWGVDRSWTNQLFCVPQAGPSPPGVGYIGAGMANSEQPWLYPFYYPDGVTIQFMFVVTSSTSFRAFTNNLNGTFSPNWGFTDSLVYDTHETPVWRYTDATGNQFVYFDVAHNDSPGQLMSFTDRGGNQTMLSYNGDGSLNFVMRTAPSGMVTDSFLYHYFLSGANVGMVSQIELKRFDNSGNRTVRQVSYVYYDGMQTYGGNSNDLMASITKDGAGNTLDVSYYRYYTSSTDPFPNGLKYVFKPTSFDRMVVAKGVTDPNPWTYLSNNYTDDALSQFADNYYVYDAQQRVTQETIQGAGCTSCQGLGMYSYSYGTPNFRQLNYNTWTYVTTETLPDDNTNTVYTNYKGQPILKIFQSGSQQWLTYFRYDNNGNKILIVDPSGVSGYSTQFDTLIDKNQLGDQGYLKAAAGLFQVMDYYGTGDPNGPFGYFKDSQIKQGNGGSPIIQRTVTYTTHADAEANTIYPMASETTYPSGTNPDPLARTTSYGYTNWFTNTNQIMSETITQPGVPGTQNGPGSSSPDTQSQQFDIYGRVTQTTDGSGFINMYAYDQATSALTQTVQDVGSAPHLNLTTTIVVDDLGRQKEVDSPNPPGNPALPQNITYTVYNDPKHEIRTYPGWNANATPPGPTGPTQVVREDRTHYPVYMETLTMSATPHLTMNLPDGSEPISRVQSVSRDVTNDAGQVAETDAYLDVGSGYSGVSYIPMAHYYATVLGYDERGRQDRVQLPTGTINRTVYDGLGRVVSTWVGTNDTPASGDWSPTNNTPPSNMNQVSGYSYDNGMVGDSNLTQAIQYPHGTSDPNLPARQTSNFYDWRDRLALSLNGVQANQNDGTHRPAYYYQYNNNDETTVTQQYDGDTILAISYNNGVPSPPNRGLLRAETDTAYDNQGRVYQAKQFSVDTSGNLSLSALTTNNWYDRRGNLVKSAPPGGLVQKMQYDGVGRLIATYQTDANGDRTLEAGWSDAQTVISTNNVLTQTETQYDGDSNAIFQITRDRFHDEVRGGVLSDPVGGPMGNQPKARASFVGSFYDLADRSTAQVNYGTHGGGPALTARPTSVPVRDETGQFQVTSYGYQADNIQTATLTGTVTGGTFRLIFGGQPTNPINYNAPPSAVQSALQGVAGTGNVHVYGAAGGPWSIRFTGSLAGQDQAFLGVDASGLQGTMPGVSVALATPAGDAGRMQQTTDPRGLVSKSDYDLLGRTMRTVQGFSTATTPFPNANAVTEYAYDGNNHVTLLSAYPSDGVVQQTGYVYGVSPSTGSFVYSNDLLSQTNYPDKTTGRPSVNMGDQEIYVYDALGEMIQKSDRNLRTNPMPAVHQTHAYSYDILGRLTSDAITVFGDNVDQTVQRLGTAYDTYGDAATFTSYGAGGSIVSQVQRTFNGLRQLTSEAQYHGDPNNPATPSGTVRYAYSFNPMNPSAPNHSRLISMTYPSGRQIDFLYTGSIDGPISRLTAISNHADSVVLEQETYLGLNTVVQRSHPEDSINLSYINLPTGSSDGGDQYNGLDRFGRVVDQYWGPSGSPTDNFAYGYDANGNRLYRANLVTQGLQLPNGFDELYHANGQVDTFDAQGNLTGVGYDALNELKAFSRGTLSTGSHANDTINNPSHSQQWSLDALGNWTSVNTDGTPQNRTTNQQNEVTNVGGNALNFDNNGNTTTDDTGKSLVYDAWNRLVRVDASLGGAHLAAYAYDALGRRNQETHYSPSATTTDLYFSSQWQVVEEQQSGSMTAQYVWSPVYVDALIERDAGGQRLYVQQDANWNVTALVALVDPMHNTWAVVERFVYDPYGRPTDASGQNVGALNPNWSTRTGGDSYGWVYLHQGGRYDGSTGLYNFRNRDLSPTLGRWLEQDPTGYVDAFNLYEYVRSQPANANDPQGLKWTVKQLLDNLRKCDGGTDIWNKAKKANNNKDPEISEGDEVSSDVETGQITLHRDDDVCKATQRLIFELSNVSRKDDLKRVGKDCAAGKLSREDFMRAFEKIEYEYGAKNLLKAFDACKEKWGCKICDLDWARPAKDFDDYYKNYLSKEHKEQYGKWWDKECKKAYNKKKGCF